MKNKQGGIRTQVGCWEVLLPASRLPALRWSECKNCPTRSFRKPKIEVCISLRERLRHEHRNMNIVIKIMVTRFPSFSDEKNGKISRGLVMTLDITYDVINFAYNNYHCNFTNSDCYL